MSKEISPELTQWSITGLRVTSFTTPSQTDDYNLENWWSKVIGEDPESITKSPRTSRNTIVGNVKIGNMKLETQPGRVDWALAGIPAFQAFPNDIIGPFPAAIDPFKEIADKFFGLDSTPSLRRIAFGTTLFRVTQNKEEGYKQLAKFLPSIRIDPIVSSDFLYRINRPRSSKIISDLTINRLSTWTVVRQISVMIAPSPFSGPETESFGCLLELDINTIENFEKPFEKGELPAILDELISLGKEIAIQGDIP